MNLESQRRATPADHQAADGLSSDPVSGAAAQEREDGAEDRRRQRELDDAELGGEA